MNHMYPILPPEDSQKEGCIKLCEGKGVVAIFRDLCLGSIDISERKKLCEKISSLTIQLSYMLGKEQKIVFLHYMNNPIHAYAFLAIEYPSITGKLMTSDPSKSQLNACDLHRIVYGVVRLFNMGSLDERLKFFDRLFILHRGELLQSSNAVLDALETAYKE